jgi:Ca2+-binding RTX toxin-like protein
MASESASTHTFGIVAAAIVIVAGGVGVAAAVLVPALNEPQPVQIGTNGPDRLSGTASDDIHIEGRGGDDNLRALGEGFDYIDGGSGDDRLVGGRGGGDYMAGPGNDYVLDTGTDASEDDGFAGGGGDDVLVDGAGSGFMSDDAGPRDAGGDVLRSGDGNDNLVLSFGADRAWAGAGNDRLQVDVDGEVDRVSCGPGDDTVQFKRREPADRYQACEHFKVYR